MHIRELQQFEGWSRSSLLPLRSRREKSECAHENGSYHQGNNSMLLSRFVILPRQLTMSAPLEIFLVAFTRLHPVGLLVCWSHFTFFMLLPKCSGGLKYSPCPPARDWGSRVSGLIESTIWQFCS